MVAFMFLPNVIIRLGNLKNQKQKQLGSLYFTNKTQLVF